MGQNCPFFDPKTRKKHIFSTCWFQVTANRLKILKMDHDMNKNQLHVNYTHICSWEGGPGVKIARFLTPKTRKNAFFLLVGSKSLQIAWKSLKCTMIWTKTSYTAITLIYTLGRGAQGVKNFFSTNFFLKNFFLESCAESSETKFGIIKVDFEIFNRGVDLGDKFRP